MCFVDTPSPQPSEPLSLSSDTDEDIITKQNADLLSLKHLDPYSMDFVPIPNGKGICRVHVVRAGVMEAPLAIFEQGAKEGETVYGICFSYLIEKLWNDGRRPTRLIYDLGLRAGVRYLFISAIIYDALIIWIPDRVLTRRGTKTSRRNGRSIQEEELQKFCSP